MARPDDSACALETSAADAAWLSAFAAGLRRTSHGGSPMSIQHERVVELCNELRLGGVAAQYSALAQKAAEKHTSFTDFVAVSYTHLDVYKRQAEGWTTPTGTATKAARRMG